MILNYRKKAVYSDELNSQISVPQTPDDLANATLTFLNTLDANNLTESCFKSMLDNNKYIEIRLF